MSMTPRHPAPGGRAWIQTSLVNPATHYSGNETASFAGVSLDVEQILAEASRAAQDFVHERMLYSSEDERAIRWETTDWKPEIYEIPIGVMVNARKLSPVYGNYTISDGRRVWGRVGEIDLVAEQKAADAREAYRVAHRDATDPVKTAIDAAAANLPERDADTPLVYVAADYRLIRREFGIFTTYESALAVAPEKAPIFQVRADGHTRATQGKRVRGFFHDRWGYASGYAPSDAEGRGNRTTGAVS